MRTMTRGDVKKLCDAWAHRPEGDPAAPLLAAPMTPAMLLWLMDKTGMKAVDIVVMPPEPYTIADVMEEGERPVPAVVPSGVMAFLRRLIRKRRGI